MSFAGDRSDNGGGNASFDSTGVRSQNRDPWNNPIRPDKKQQSAGGGNSDDKTGGTEDDNAGIDDDVIAKIWDKEEKKDSQQQQQPVIQQQQPQQVDTDKQLKDYLQSVGLNEFTISEAEKEAASNGDFGPMMTRINQQIVQSHMKSLSGTQKIVEEAVKKAVGEVKNQSVSYMMGQQNLQKLNEALPWTKEKHIAPVATSVMQRFLDRGWDTQKAIDGVKRYFEDINSRINGGNKSRSTNFSSGQSDEQKENNWLDVLSPSGR